eukprot:UN28262
MITTLKKLFVPARHRSHRLLGLCYLVQFCLAVYLYTTNFDRYLQSYLTFSLAMTGWLQSVNASLTFTFMPSSIVPGYVAMSDKAPLSYLFIVENSFFAMLLFYQTLYMYEPTAPFIPKPVEYLFVFFPYYIRPLWPKTSMRDSWAAQNKHSSDKNRYFNYISSLFVKAFYNFAKHYIGFFLNYLRFLGLIRYSDKWIIMGILLVGSYQTTVAIFLHTLSFKKYVDHRTASLAYTLSYSITIAYYIAFLPIITTYLDIFLIVFVGLVLNFGPKPIWHLYQFGIFVLLVFYRDTYF